MTKFFLLFSLLALFSLCPFLPRQPLGEPTTPPITKTTPPRTDQITPTLFVETPTATLTEVPPSSTPTTTPEILPSPTNEPLILSNLQPITAENIQDLAVVAEIPYHQLKPNYLIHTLKFSQDGTKLAIGSQNWENRNNNLLVWDLINNDILFDSEDEDPIIWGDVYFSPEGNQLWGFRQGFFDQYDLQSGNLVSSTAVPEYTGSAVALSPDGKTLVTGVFESTTPNSTVYFYEFGSLDPYFSEAIAYGIMRYRFSPDSRMVAGTSAQIGNTITKIWDVKTGTMLKDFYDYDYGPTFSADSTLAAFAKGNQFSIFSTDSWILRKTFQNDNTASTNFPKFLLDENQIVAIQQTVTMTFNNANTGDELLELPAQATISNYSAILNVIVSNTNLDSIKFWGIIK